MNGRKDHTYGKETREEEYGEFMNEHWIRPSKEESPEIAAEVKNTYY